MMILRTMATFVRLVLLSIVFATVAPSFANEPKRSDQQSFLTRAVFADGRLWVLSDAGELSSIGDRQDARVAEPLTQPVLELCVRNGQPAVIAGADDANRWTLLVRSGATWVVAAQIESGGDRLLAMDCAGNQVTLLTTRRLIDVDNKGQRAISLAGELGSGLVSSIYRTPQQFFVGLNAGEWGGGLRRIDRRSGVVTVIERNSSGDLCGGPLNTDCDPVTGIVAAPGKSDCIVAAIGLVHFIPRGRVVEVCGDQVRPLYFKPYGENPPGKNPRDQPLSTVAFFSLALKDGTLWAMGIDGVYAITAAGNARVVPLPQFKEVGGIRVSFDMPDFVLVLTNVNQRRSISGAVPLLVPR
jgi:hypothetical protein